MDRRNYSSNGRKSKWIIKHLLHTNIRMSEWSRMCVHMCVWVGGCWSRRFNTGSNRRKFHNSIIVVCVRRWANATFRCWFCWWNITQYKNVRTITRLFEHSKGVCKSISFTQQKYYYSMWMQVCLMFPDY